MAGYSEGGPASFSAALAVQDLGQEIVNLDMDGASLNPSKLFVFIIAQIDQGDGSVCLPDQLAQWCCVFVH